MQLGMIGLGRMGANMVRRLMRGGHECVVWDVSADNIKTLAGEGAIGTGSLDDFIAKLNKPRAVWIMVPAGAATERPLTIWGSGLIRVTSSLTAAIHILKTMRDARARSKTKALTMWTLAPAAACGASNVATA